MKEDDEGADDLKGLTIVLTDPDAPSRESPEWSEVCHWIGKVPLKKIIKKGDGPRDGLELSMARGDAEDVKECKYMAVLLSGLSSCPLKVQG